MHQLALPAVDPQMSLTMVTLVSTTVSQLLSPLDLSVMLVTLATLLTLVEDVLFAQLSPRTVTRAQLLPLVLLALHLVLAA